MPLVVALVVLVAFTGGGRAETAAPEPGLYSGPVAPNGNGMQFYVPPSRTKVEDLDIYQVAIPCTDGFSVSTQGGIIVDSMDIGPKRSFTDTEPMKGVVIGNQADYLANFEFHVEGRFSSSTEASGTYSETAAYKKNGSTITCSLPPTHWGPAPLRDLNPEKQAAVGDPGTYSLRESQNGNGGSFNVSADPAKIEKLDFHPELHCNHTIGDVPLSGIQLDSIALNSNGSFDTGPRDLPPYDTGKYTVMITLDFRGHFHGQDPDGRSQAAGSYDMTGTFTYEGTNYTCRSNKEWWQAVRTG